MNKTMKKMAALLLALMLAVGLISCGSKKGFYDLWRDAIYEEDTSIGEGNTSFTVEVEVEERCITVDVKTNETTVGAALLANGLVEGEDGPYGLYIKKVNGITADYDIDHSYWLFYINGEYAMTGVDSTEVAEGAVYRFVYTRE